MKYKEQKEKKEHAVMLIPRGGVIHTRRCNRENQKPQEQNCKETQRMQLQLG